MRRLAMLWAALVVSALPVSGQADTRADFQVWNALLSTAKLSDDAPDVRLWLDVHLRRGENINTVIARPGLGYVLADWASVWAGYAWVPVTRDGTGMEDATAHEHRIWQQLVLKGSAVDGAVALMARTRFEQRLLEDNSEMALRIRQFARVGYRPGNKGVLGLSMWDELFWGLSDTDLTAAGYDQNRLFVGPAFFVRKGMRLEGGYLFVHLNREPTNQIQHVFALNVFATL